ncbi:MAG: ATP-binding protein, partial [Verrucomicrobiota bacterium]
LRGKDGNYRWFLSRAFPLRDAEGKIVQWFGTNTDVTELREAQKQLKEHAETLEQTVNDRTASLQETIEQLEEFSYSVAHDLRAPLRAMQGYANAVLSDYGDQIGERGKDYLQRISNAGLRMDQLTSDTLTYSKVARASMPRKTVSLDKLVPEIIQHYPQMHAAQAEITVERPLLPVVGNEIWLTKAISNLLTNAVKFVTKGTKPQIRIRTEKRDGQVRLWIEDNGIGIKPEYQSRLFGMFERLDPSNQYEGTGIGLAIVRKSIERMGGTVGLESDGKTGSQFWIQLPAPQEKS